MTMDDVSGLFTIHDLPGHASYFLIAISYWLTRIFWLRVTAIAGLFLEICYFSLSGGDLRTGVAWDAIFIIINLYQLFWLIRERMMLRLPPAHEDVLRRAMTGLADADIARLLKAGDLVELPDGSLLTRENQELTKLYFICSGEVHVSVGGVRISELGKGGFIGEVAFISGKSATASVATAGSATLLVFDHHRLKDFLGRQSQVATVFYELLGRDLAAKIKSSNSLLAAAQVQRQAAVEVP